MLIASTDTKEENDMALDFYHGHGSPFSWRVWLALEHKDPLATGTLPDHCEMVSGEFWTGEIARHDRLRLAYAVWTVLSRRLLGD